MDNSCEPVILREALVDSFVLAREILDIILYNRPDLRGVRLSELSLGESIVGSGGPSERKSISSLVLGDNPLCLFDTRDGFRPTFPRTSSSESPITLSTSSDTRFRASLVDVLIAPMSSSAGGDLRFCVDSKIEFWRLEKESESERVGSLGVVDSVAGGSEVEADLKRMNEEARYPAAVAALSCLGREGGGGLEARVSSSSSMMESTARNGVLAVGRFGSGEEAEKDSGRLDFSFVADFWRPR